MALSYLATFTDVAITWKYVYACLSSPIGAKTHMSEVALLLLQNALHLQV